MRRVAASLLVSAAALAAAPAAFAWKTIAAGVTDAVVPSLLVTQAGTELISFESPAAGTISVARAGAAPRAVVGGDPIAGRTQLVQLPDGAIELYYPDGDGVARLESRDDGVSWSGPFRTRSHDVGGVVSAAVAPDGTPYFTQDGTGFVNVFRGLNGDSVANVFARCCGYGESVAVDSTGLVQVAFYSNADADGKFVVEQLGPDLAPAATVEFARTAPRDDRVPLVADRDGLTYLGWAPGYPSATAFAVEPFNRGTRQVSGMGARMSFGGGDPHMALSVDPADRLWAVWTGHGKVWATRSRGHAAHTGAIVAAAVPGTAYQVSAAGLPGNPGAVDVVVNTGSALVEQQLRPGLAVRVFRTTKKVGKKKVVTRWAQALDDRAPVASATFVVGGKKVRADAGGKARVPRGAGRAQAPGYAGAAFRVP